MAFIHDTWGSPADFYRKYKPEYMNRAEVEEAIAEFEDHVATIEAHINAGERARAADKRGRFPGQREEDVSNLLTAKDMLERLKAHRRRLDELGVAVIPQPDPREHMPEHLRKLYKGLEWDAKHNEWVKR